MTDPNRWALESIARSLGSMNQDVVYVGGAVAGVLITDPAAPRIRATNDVDCIVRVATRSEYDTRIRSMLVERGFVEMQGKGVPICAWTRDGLRLDVLPTPDFAGFGNRWFDGAMDDADEHRLSGIAIRVISPPYYLATKLDAFLSRGRSDYLTSHDLEDIVAVIDGRPEIVDDVHTGDENVTSYLAKQFADLLNDDNFLGVLPGLVTDSGRGHVVRDRMRRIVAEGD